MTGKTHRAGGMLCSLVGFALLKDNNLLLPDVNEGLQWLVMYPFCMWGSIASDLDHHWESCPSKDYPSWLVNKALHITAPVQKVMDKNLSNSQKKHNLVYKLATFLNAKHRSWQTHSDLTLFAMLFLLYSVISGAFTSLGAVDVIIANLVITGVCLGIIAHFILDVLTPEGVWLTLFVVFNRLIKSIFPRFKGLPEKLHLVPHKKFFATGESWEMFVQKVLKVLTVLSLIWFLLTFLNPYIKDIIPYTITFNQ